MRAIIVVLGLSQIIGYGSIYYAFPILVPGVAASFEVGEPLLYAIFSVGLFIGGFAAPAAGRAMDRIGAPIVMTIGSVAAVLGLIAVSVAPSLWLYAAGIIALEAISVMILYDAAFAALVRFAGGEARRDIVRLTLIAGFASTIFWPLTGWLAGQLGWRGTYMVFGGMNFAAMGLHLWLVRQRPTGAGPEGVMRKRRAEIAVPLPDGDRRGAFAAVALSFALSAALISAFGVQMVPIFEAAGLGAGATLVAMLMGPAQVAIRLIDSLFWHNLHPLTVGVISALALPLAVIGLILGLPVWLAAPAFAMLFGAGGGLSSIVRGSVPLALFGPDGYGGRLGKLALVRTIVSSAAPFAFAALLAWAGLNLTLGLFFVLGLGAALPLVMLRLRLGRAGRLAPLR